MPIDVEMVRGWVAAGLLEAARSFPRMMGCTDLPTLVAAVQREAARRTGQTSQTVTATAVWLGCLTSHGPPPEKPQGTGHRPFDLRVTSR